MKLNMSPSLLHDDTPLRTCPVCRWHGVPTYRNHLAQRECPSCHKPVLRELTISYGGGLKAYAWEVLHV
jgi:hypothetical protein